MEDLNSSTLSSVASIPKARIALSPGITDITTNVMRDTKSSTKSAERILLFPIDILKLIDINRERSKSKHIGRGYKDLNRILYV